MLSDALLGIFYELMEIFVGWMEQREVTVRMVEGVCSFLYQKRAKNQATANAFELRFDFFSRKHWKKCKKACKIVFNVSRRYMSCCRRPRASSVRYVCEEIRV